MPLLSRRALTLGGAFSLLVDPVQASTWPNDTVTWIVPAAPGGQADAFARPVAQFVTERLGQSVIVDNRGGAGGTIGATQARNAAADGYTFLVGNTALTYAPVVYPHAGLNVTRDFAPISALARVQSCLIVNPARLDARSVQDFVDRARAAPGTIDMASPGPGTVQHLAIEMLQDRAGIELNHVPYRGGAPALQDLLAGNVAAAFLSISTLLEYVKRGDLRVLGVAGRRREPLLPEVPTMDEAGIKDFRAVLWFGLFAPRQTPPAILDRLHDVVQAALGNERIRSLWQAQAGRVEPESRADFARFVDLEVGRWQRIARAADLQPD